MSRSSLAAGLVLTGALLASSFVMLGGRQRGVAPKLPRGQRSASGSTRLADSSARPPQVWAVIVGIDLYDDPQIPRCHGAIRDGGALARWFTETARWDKGHILLMNENGALRPGRPEDELSALSPTRENLDWALRQWLGSRTRPGDIAVLYFAGQAAVADDREFLLPIDARAGDLARTGWSPEEAIDELTLKMHCQMVLWLDTSPLGRGRPVAQAATEPTAGLRFLNRLTRWPGVTAWLAADGHPAAEGPGPEQGPFLAALGKGLGKQPSNLAACLDQMVNDPVLRSQGFRFRGGVPPRLTLWPEDILPEHRFNPELTLRQGHADAVTGVVLSIDGQLMVTASLDSTVRIWRVRDREQVLLRVLPYHTIGVTALALSPDDRFLASGDGAGQVRVWDLTEWRERHQQGASPHKQRIVGLGFLPAHAQDGSRVVSPDKSPDVSRLVSLDQDGKTTLWTIAGPLLDKKSLLPPDVEVVRMAVASRKGPTAPALALADSDGMLILIGSDGKPQGRPFGGTGGRPTALQLAPDGRRIVTGDEAGRVRVWDVERKAIVFRHDYTDQKIGAIRLGPMGGLAVGAGDQMYHVAEGQDGPGLALEGVGDEVDSALFSDDGRWLAALTARGNWHLWSAADRAHPVAQSLAIEGRSTGASWLAFGREGRRLVAGERDGGIRGWDLPDCRERPRIPPRRGKVGALAVSGDGRFLLEITRDGLALIWDLKDGRGARILPGRWTSAAFLPDNSLLVMTHDAKHGGDVVLVDRESGQIRAKYERPLDPETNAALRVNFGRVAVAPDGRKVAASATAGQVEVACVWDVQGGPPRILNEGDVPTSHARTITALDFSGDGRSLLTASEDGTAKLWNLAPERPVPDRPNVVLDAARGGAIMAAQISPANPRRIVTAHWDPDKFLGEVFLSDWRPGQPTRSLKLGDLSDRPHAVVFTPDGRWVGVAGQEKRFHFWNLEEGRRPATVQFEKEQWHTEQVKALIAWPVMSMIAGGGAMIASGGDDTTVRLWTLDPKTHRGTLLGTLMAGPAVPEVEARWDWSSLPPPIPDWVAFTPDGVYDSSFDGDRMVSFVIDREVMPLEQYAGKFRKVQLTDDLRQGKKSPPPASTAPPALVIDPPPALDLQRRDTELGISLSDPSLNREELRLYQNGVPVQDGDDFQPLENRGHFVAKVRLRSGVNRFYAMAGRRGDIDARSQDVEIRYVGPETPGQIHVLAIGVQDYGRNSLRYASHDAVQIADHLHQYGAKGVDRPGKKIVLTDGQVTEVAVDDAFTDLRRAVKGRPEDAVVIFLAGHTDVLKDATGRERFSLLLPPFPFPPGAPALAANRGVGIAGAGGEPLPPGVDLPFFVIYRNLSHLDALQRLIIIDACQAEAIHNDPRVRQIQQVLEKDTYRARTSYLLAARRGESANESSMLEHGLLTYVLLRGMEAPGLRPLPINLPPIEDAPNADEDGDGIVTTHELRGFADRMLPLLASQLPDLAQRIGPVGLPLPLGPLRVQASEGIPFELIRLPGGAGRRQQP